MDIFYLFSSVSPEAKLCRGKRVHGDAGTRFQYDFKNRAITGRNNPGDITAVPDIIFDDDTSHGQRLYTFGRPYFNWRITFVHVII